MRIPLSWLKERIDLGSISTTQIVTLMTEQISEIEDVITFDRVALKKFVVGKITAVSDSQNSGIHTVQVDIGNKIITLCVSSDYTIRAHQNVIVGLPGAKPQSGPEIKERVFEGGMKSAGRLCSERDLGIGSDTTNILYVNLDITPGTSAYDAFELDDIIFEFDLEPHRPDLFGAIGIARDVAAILDKPLKPLEVSANASLDQLDRYGYSLSVHDFQACPRYDAILFKGYERLPQSPQWLVNLVWKFGMRSLGLVVDLTNLVMFETGQPLHAFDAERLESQHICVGLSKPGEKCVTLDSVERQLPEGSIMIYDDSKAVAIGGIMGAKESVFDENSQTLILEGANFDMTRIRKSSRIMSLRTEASLRFEKGLDPNGVSLAMKRFRYLLEKTSSWKAVAYDSIYPKPEEPHQIRISLPKLLKRLDIPLSKERVLNILSRLGFDSELAGDHIITTVPSYRRDISIKQDIIEEVGRIVGYQNIPSTPLEGSIAPPQKNENYIFESQIKDLLKCCGYSEIILGSFVGEDLLQSDSIPIEYAPEIRNPLSRNERFLRPCLVNQLLRIAAKNIRYQENVLLYELGRIYFNDKHHELVERRQLAGVISLPNTSNMWDTAFYHAKGIVEQIARRFGLRIDFFHLDDSDANAWTLPPVTQLLDTNRAAAATINRKLIGILGEIDPIYAAAMDLNITTAFFVLDVDTIQPQIQRDVKFHPPSKYPPVLRDLCFILKPGTWAESVSTTIQNVGGPFLKTIKIYDLYSGKGVPKNHTSITWRLHFESPDRSLRNQEIQDVLNEIVQNVNREHKAVLRM